MKFQTRFLELMLKRVTWNMKVFILQNMYTSPKSTLYNLKELELIYEMKFKYIPCHCGLYYFI